jgi:predicted GNAT family acetyltransferase
MSTTVQQTEACSLLDNPIWHALNSRQRELGRGRGFAAGYVTDVSRFVAVAQPSPEAFVDLAALVQPGETVALAMAAPFDLPEGWKLVRSRPLDQMVWDHPEGSTAALDLRLKTEDVPEMLSLAQATDPGPFSEGTIRTGRYYGVRSKNGRLIAMAGERMRLDGFTEISAVCTDPAFRGHGYARALVTGLAVQALAEGSTPFLHVKTEIGAKGLYDALGFRLRRGIQLTVLTRV